jgi:UDP-N-acetylmuramate--alanine ligase
MRQAKDHYHFIGIGGDGMSGLARILFEQGCSVSGSNIEENRRVRELLPLGIPVYLGHSPEHLPRAGTVVFSSAITAENIELRAARDQRLQVLHRQELLAQLMNNRPSIGIAGTHGKTTTTAMIAMLFERGGLDPTFLIGSPTRNLGGHAKWGSGPHLVAEVDESDGRFTQLKAQVAVITNIDRDHLNYYGDEQALQQGFQRFLNGCDFAVLSADDAHTAQLQVHAPRLLTFGIEHEADLQARNLQRSGLRTSCELFFQGRRVCTLELGIPGRHNVANALAAMAVGHLNGLGFAEMRAILKEFALPERRFQVLEENGMTVVDDYAHLPAQIEINLQTIREGWNPRRLLALFQPHRYTRMSYMSEQFARSFALADLVVVTDIYPAFESPIPGVNASALVEAIRREHPHVYYAQDKAEVFTLLQRMAQPGDFIIGFGPGDIWQVLYRFAALGGTPARSATLH